MEVSHLKWYTITIFLQLNLIKMANTSENEHINTQWFYLILKFYCENAKQFLQRDYYYYIN